jgi:D-arabinose 1-dehydrogenase-like Zn-dependent alcohol dehydrogenase
MRAYAVQRFCEPLEILDTADPVPKGTEVVIEVTRCGVCHSDLHIHEGYYDLGGGKKLSLADRGVTPPVVMGHEVLGKLVAKGPDAPIADSEIGKTFVVFPWLGCGECDICKRGDDNLCPKPNAIGVHRGGGYAEKCVVPHPKFLVDATGVDHTLAATFACSGLTAYSAVKKVQADREKDTILVIGAGGVGQSAINVLRMLGHKHIAVADIDPAKRDNALKAGASVAVDPRDADALAKVMAMPGGVAGALDFVGAPSTANFGIAALRRTGTYVVVGLFGGDITVSLPLVILRTIVIRGSYVGNLAELKELIGFLREGRIATLPVEEIAMAEVNTALTRLREGKVKGRLVLAR